MRSRGDQHNHILRVIHAYLSFKGLANAHTHISTANQLLSMHTAENRGNNNKHTSERMRENGKTLASTIQYGTIRTKRRKFYKRLGHHEKCDIVSCLCVDKKNEPANTNQ